MSDARFRRVTCPKPECIGIQGRPCTNPAGKETPGTIHSARKQIYYWLYERHIYRQMYGDTPPAGYEE